MPGRGRDIAVTGVSSDIVWVIGNGVTTGGYTIHRWTGTTWQTIPGGAVRITIDGAGRPWAVNNGNGIFRYSGAAFVPIPGCARDIGGGMTLTVTAGSVWVIGCTAIGADYSVHRWNGSVFEQVPGAGVRIAVDAAGRPWVVNAAGAIFRRNSSALTGTWEQMPGLAQDVGVGLREVWVTGPDNTIWERNLKDGPQVGWRSVPGSAINVSVGSGPAWITDAAQHIHRYRTGL
jgi:hypothetical protein